MVGYGIKVKFPCIKVDTPWGPLQIGGKCGEEARAAEQGLAKVPPPSPYAAAVPVILVGGVIVAGLLLLRGKRRQ